MLHNLIDSISVLWVLQSTLKNKGDSTSSPVYSGKLCENFWITLYNVL